MNNKDFRRFVFDTAEQPQDGSSGGFVKPAMPSTSLGSRSKSSIPMTPRSIKGKSSINFARQLADHQDGASQSQRKFKSSAAPKGTKLAAGYQDRTLHRGDDTASRNNDKEARIKALEEQLRLGQLDRGTFEKLRDSITEGDVRATHLVKGLDYKLLERVRRGEDVLSSKPTEPKADEKVEALGKTADDELDELEQKDVVPVERENIAKRGERAQPPPVAGAKRSRNDILAELKASRRAAQEAPTGSQLSSKFRKFGETKSTAPRIERDASGREVLITIDEHGRVKRKVRKVDQEDNKKALLMPDKAAKPLGMEVPVTLLSNEGEKDEDEDIFSGVGATYDPLGVAADDNEDTSSSSSSEDITAFVPPRRRPSRSSSLHSSRSSSRSVTPEHDDLPSTVQQKRNNYFNDTQTSTKTTAPSNPLHDPAVLASLKRAAAASERISGGGNTKRSDGVEELSAPKSAAARLAARDRDLDDIDMGFGSSRYGDEEDDDGGGVRLKLSEWKDGAGEDEDDVDEAGNKRGGANQRKRGKKKRKGDKNSAADVMKAIESRRK